MNSDPTDPSYYAREDSEPATAPGAPYRTISVVGYGNTVSEIEQDALAKAVPVFEGVPLALVQNYRVVQARGAMTDLAGGKAYYAVVSIREVTAG